MLSGTKEIIERLKEYQRVCSLAAKYKNQSEILADIAIKLHHFVKTHNYPKEATKEFFELTQLFDDLETILKKEKFIK